MKNLFIFMFAALMFSLPGSTFGATDTPNAFSGVTGSVNTLTTGETNTALNQGTNSFTIDAVSPFDTGAFGSLSQACGGSATGGSVSNTLSGSDALQKILRVGPSLITCVSGTNCPSGTGSIPGLSGLAGSSINTLLNIFGGGNITQSILNLAGQNAGQILSALGLSGGGGSAGSAISNALGGSGISGIAGGALGSVLGGGSAVPVADKETRDNTKRTRDATEALKHKETCTDIIAYNLAQNAQAQTTAKILAQTNALQITNFQEFAVHADQSLVKNFIDRISQQNIGTDAQTALQELIARSYNEDTTFSLQSLVPKQNASHLDNFKRVFVDGGSLRGAYISTLNQLQVESAASNDALEKSLGNTYRPQVTCIDANGNETKGLIEDCVPNYKIVTPSSIVESQAETAINAGNERLAQTDEAGEVANQFMVQLFQQALTNIGGLLSLSEKGSGTVVTGNSSGSATGSGNGADSGAGDVGNPAGPSYLDQLGNNTQTVSIDSGRSLLTQSISSSISTEEAYQRTLAIMVDDLGRAGGAFDQVRQCYIGLTKRIVTGLSTATALERANQASTTVATIFAPQIERRLAEIADSELVVGELVRLGGLARDASSVEELNAVSDSFDALLSSGLVHSTNDLAFLENDREVASVALQSVADEAYVELSECRQL